MVEFFNRKVLPWVASGQEVTAVKRVRATYEPGRQCAILYTLHFGDEPGDASRSAVVTFGSNLREVFTRHYGSNASPSGRRAATSAVVVPEHQCLVEFFPFDWKLPDLAQATNPERMAVVLGWRRDTGSAPGPRPEVKTLRYVPHRRCVLGYSLRSPAAENSAGNVVIKVYPPGPLARQSWCLLDTLNRQAATSEITVPRPLGMVGEWNLLPMEQVRGTSLKKALKKAPSRDAARQAIRRAAIALATLHSLHVEGLPLRSHERYVTFLQGEAAGVYPVAPALAHQAQALLRQAMQLSLSRSHPACTFIHGDFQPSQLFIDDGRVAVVDFDNACIGDPAMDIGNFTAKLHRRAVSKRQDCDRHLADDFLAEYTRHVVDNGLEQRARIYQVLALVRAAIHTFRRAPISYAHEGPESLPVLLLQEAKRCLAA